MQSKKYYTYNTKGRLKSALVTVEEFESWQETMDVAREMPDLSKNIKEFKKEYKKGEYKNWTTLEDLFGHIA